MPRPSPRHLAEAQRQGRPWRPTPAALALTAVVLTAAPTTTEPATSTTLVAGRDGRRR